MNRFGLAAVSFPLLTVLCACDKGADSPKSNLSAPEPVSLYRPARQSTINPEALSSAKLPADLIEETPTTAGEDLAALKGPGNRFFDGAGKMGAGVMPAAVTSSGRPVVVRRAGMSINTDGRITDRRAYAAVAHGDRWRKDETALRYRNGQSLDPTRVPYIVLPLGYRGAKLGDLAYVEYNGRGSWAVVGDYGPPDRFGEGSSALAASLGINPSGKHGGVEAGVKYTIFPGTGRSYPSEASLKSHVDVQSAELVRPAGSPTGVMPA